MFRIRLLCRLAVTLGFIPLGSVNRLLAAYRAVLAANPQTPFVQWAIKQGAFTKAQAHKIKQAYDKATLRCNDCDKHFRAGQSDILKPLVCVACGSEELALLEDGEERIGDTLLEFDAAPLKMLENTGGHPKPKPQDVARQRGGSGGRHGVNLPLRSLESEDDAVTASGEATPGDSKSLTSPQGRDFAVTETAPVAAGVVPQDQETSLFEPPRQDSAPRPDKVEEDSSSYGNDDDDDDFLDTAELAETFAPPPPKKPSPSNVANALPGTYRSKQARYDVFNDEPTETNAGSDRNRPARVARPQTAPASGRREAIPKGARIAGCRILKKIGQGGMGAVYKAHHERLNKPVAVKILAPHLVENEIQVKRFIREGQSAARLEHPNIVTVHDVGEEDGRFYLIMQWVDGKSLQEILEEREVLPADNAVDYTIQAAQGLQAAHDQGIIHRDIKPDNLMLTYDGRIKVTDFGLAKGTKEDLRVSQTGMILGTPYYMSPEQGQSDGVDHRTDIYSLGISLYQLLTGKVPFTGSSAVQIIVRHIKEKMPPPRMLVPTLPEDLEAVVLHMTAKDRGVRYQSMQAVITDLERLRPSLSHEAPDPKAVPEPSAFLSTPAEVTEEERTSILRNLMAARDRDIEEATGSRGKRGTRKRKRSAAAMLMNVFIALLLVAAGAAAAYYAVEGVPEFLEDIIGGGDDPADEDTPEPIATNGNGNNNDEVDPPNGAPNGEPDPNGEPTENGDNDNGNGNGNDTDPNGNGNGNGDEDPPNGEPDNGNGDGDGNGNGTDDNDNDVPTPSEQEERLRAAWEDFESLVSLFENDETEYERYDDYRNLFHQMRIEYRRLPEIREAIEAHLERMSQLLDRGAEHWWHDHIPEYRDFLDRKRYGQAIDVLDTLPGHFADTPTARDLARRRADNAPQARLESEAAEHYERLDAALDREASQTAIEDAQRLLDQFVRSYRDTRFGDEIPSLRARLEQMQRRLSRELDERDRERLERILVNLRTQVTNDLRDNRWRTAMRRIDDVRADFEGTDMQPQLDAIERSIRDEATQAWESARERIEREIAAGNYLEVLRRLDEASDGALREHVEQAQRMRTQFIETYVPQRLQVHEDARDPAAGMALVEEFLGVADFQPIVPLIERYQRRFELLERGFVPVSVPDDEVEAPDGSGTWRVEEFWMSTQLVTRAEYREFIAEGGYHEREYWCDDGWALVEAGEFQRIGINQPAIDWRRGRPTPGTESWPVTSISYYEAKAYAAWAGMELASVKQWRIAAGYDPALNDGAGGFRRYPWGEDFRTVTGEVRARLTVGESLLPQPSPVGSYPGDVSPFGIFDMAGNVAEWTRDPAEVAPRQWVVGGWFNAFPDQAERIARTMHRQDLDRHDRSPWIGLRLVTRPD